MIIEGDDGRDINMRREEQGHEVKVSALHKQQYADVRVRNLDIQLLEQQATVLGEYITKLSNEPLTPTGIKQLEAFEGIWNLLHSILDEAGA